MCLKSLCLLSLVVLGLVSTASAGPFAIRLANHPEKALTVDRDGDMRVTENRPRKFEIVPGLASPKEASSLEMLGSRGHFIRHMNAILRVHVRPAKVNLVFEGDATWKIIQLEGGKVRFESVNYPGTYISVRDDGAVLQRPNPPLEESTFLLKDQ